ncbi:hypothetical protein ACLOJK_018171 [Asimina triloba]
MASVKVYGPPMSTSVSRVLVCLIEKDVDFQLLNIDMSKGHHKTPQFLKMQRLFNDPNRSSGRP